MYEGDNICFCILGTLRIPSRARIVLHLYCSGYFNSATSAAVYLSTEYSPKVAKGLIKMPPAITTIRSRWLLQGALAVLSSVVIVQSLQDRSSGAPESKSLATTRLSDCAADEVPKPPNDWLPQTIFASTGVGGAIVMYGQPYMFRHEETDASVVLCITCRSGLGAFTSTASSSASWP